MIRLFYTCFLISYFFTASGQNSETYIVKAGEVPEKAISPAHIYFFSSFTNGTATLKNGSTSAQRFNYNCLLDELQFLSVNGDTLAIAEPGLLRKVEIDSAVYYYDKGYLRQIAKTDKNTLALKERIFPVDRRKASAYGGTSGSSAIDNYSNIYRDGRFFKLESREDILFKKQRQFFLGNKYDHFIPAEKRGFYDVFADKRNIISDFIKQQKINFNNPDDVKKLFDYCTSN